MIYIFYYCLKGGVRITGLNIGKLGFFDPPPKKPPWEKIFSVLRLEYENIAGFECPCTKIPVFG